MKRAGQPAPRGLSTGNDRLSTGHADAVVTAGMRPDGRGLRPHGGFPAAAPPLVRRP
jgi:hypothetical protein